jgi:flagellar motor switch protein FliG
MQGYSQRRMAQTLNDEGFSAPEGGHWVLSQLQKVLDRIDMNDVALTLCASLDEFDQKGYNNSQIAKALTAMRAKSPGRKPWDDYLVGKVKERLQTIREIADFNEFVVLVYPHVLEYLESGLSDEDIAKLLNQDGVQIPERVIWELEHENEDEVTEIDRAEWEAHDVEVARRIAERRKADISHYVHPHTLQRSEVLFKEFTGVDIAEKVKVLDEKTKKKEKQ